MREHIIKKIRSAFPAAKDLTWPQVKEIVLAENGGFSSDRAAKEWFYKRKKSILNTAAAVPVKIADNSLVEYNKDADQYAFFPEQDSGLVGTFVISGSKIRSIVRNYSSVAGKSETTTKISQSFGIPRRAVIHILKALDVKKDSLPWTKEELAEKSDDELITDYVERRNFQVGQKIARKNYELLKKDADSWNNFKAGTLDPFESVLENFSVKESPATKPTKNSGEKVILVGFTDVHIADFYECAFSGTSYNSQIAAAKVKLYAQKIAEKNKGKAYSHCELMSLGDIVNSFVDGATRRGTHLRNDKVNEELFEFALDVIIGFIAELNKIFGKVNVRWCRGNHDSFQIENIARAAKKYFEKNKAIEFFIYKEFIFNFTVNSALILGSHGGHESMKAVSVPAEPGPKMDAYVHSIMLDNRKLISTIRRCYFLSGHRHSYRHNHGEKSHYEFFVLSAMVPATEHSNVLGYRNISRSQCIVLDGNGDISEIQHIYLDLKDGGR